ncbi:MAG TPA: hypothetical protein VKR06_09695 [Ktedonosporobacter sp.]|nr:hypothetical protein [Ktedonosporobacter sp.]
MAIGIIAMLLKSLDPNEFNVARCLDVCGLGLLTVTVLFSVPCLIIGGVLLVMGFFQWRRKSGVPDPPTRE